MITASGNPRALPADAVTERPGHAVPVAAAALAPAPGAEASAPAAVEWYKEWFGEEYLRLYPHRDQGDADRLVALLRSVVPLRPGWRVLDVGCGPGRHARALERAGVRCIGVDLSANLLQWARGATAAALVRADMRALPIRRRTMDIAVNLCTSFGFFESDREHVDTLCQMADAVRHGGWFALDALNAASVRAAVAASPAAAGPPTIGRRRLSADGRFVFKIVRIAGCRVLEERVRLFTPPELEGFLREAGVRVRHRFGDYEGGPLRASATRTLLIGDVL